MPQTSRSHAAPEWMHACAHAARSSSPACPRHCTRILHKLGRSHQANGLLTSEEVAQVEATPLEDLFPMQSSAFVGVSWLERNRKWVAQIRFLNRRYHLGYFEPDEEVKAALVADRAQLIANDWFVHDPSRWVRGLRLHQLA
jgi:hypothetical protein